jgi:hypothetical protein
MPFQAPSDQEVPSESSVPIWHTHDWRERRLELEGKPLLHYQCSRCRRDFVEDLSTNERYAVYVSIFQFVRLPNEVSGRWLTDRCPTSTLETDDNDRHRRD